MALPLVYAVVTAVKPLDEFFVFPPRFFARNPTLQNFSELFRLMNSTRITFLRYVFNTVFVAVTGTLGHVILSSACAYSVSKLYFRGKEIMFRIVVISLMFTSSVTAIPSFMIMKQMGFINTYFALIIPAFASPLGLYLMKQFMDQMIHDTVLEAARIDGANEWTVFTKIVMPSVKPAWMTLIVFSFQGLWNMGSSTYIFREDLKMLNYALTQVLAGGISRSGAAAASAVLIMIVPVCIFIFTQRNVVETLSTSGMKD